MPTTDAAPGQTKPPSRAAQAASGTVSATAAATPAVGGRGDEQLRFILSGQSTHTGMFIIDCTSPKGQPLPVFMNVVATEIIKRVEPYAAAIALFKEMHRTHALMRHEPSYAALKSVVDGRLDSEAGSEDSDADFAAFRNLLGMAAMMAGKNDDAEREFLKASEIDPHMGYAWTNAGLLYLSQGRFDKALEMTEHAQATDTVRRTSFLLANALTVEALARWGKKDLQGASDTFLEAAHAYPGTFFVYYYWAKLMAATGNTEAAAELSRRANANLSSFETYPESALLYFKVRAEQDFSLVHLNLKLTKTVADVDAQK
jgi:tetratricopeptide (TPR) repeat protein